ncbi:hypothetical protein DLAC_09326 [Tieghemostelium lacteum]|uniref:Uncharacterized protein n=1 Tax=Tieghemostelium lacteum TaxID=361077 RepID=A0A151Z9R8_TIELA|nr:hypothetical protein DLAC_09326 [Tieghemostelium lacteum]|eukprot:KYQ90691.1 hypothetical protein DLAC_09326 [Tieghemostelium lacteum]
MDNPTYLIYKTKFNINNPYTPVDIHPVNPWILYCDSDNNIIIQNYQNNEKLLNFSILQHDEEKRELMMIQKRVPTLSSLNTQTSPGSNSINYVGAQGGTVTVSSNSGGLNSSGTQSQTSNNNQPLSPQIPSIQVSSNTGTLHRNASNSSNAMKSSLNTDSISQQNKDDISEKIEKLGQIKFLYFHDRFTRIYKDKKPKISQNKFNKSSNNSNSNSTSSSVGIEDNIVVVAENRIVIINYHSQRLREIKIPLFETKSPSSVEFFSNLPLIAFGGPDSVIRLWNLDKWELEKQLTGGHTKGSIVKLKVIEMENEILASVGTDGYCCLWNMKSGSLAHQFPKTGHEFIDLAYDHVSGYILALTDDRIIYTYDPVGQKEVTKVSCGKKDSFQSLEPFYHPKFNGLDLMLSTKSPAVISFFNRLSPTSSSSSSSSASSLSSPTGISYNIDIDQLLNTSKKEKSKLYRVFQHPMNPSMLVCWINKSIYILSMSSSSVPVCTSTFSLTLNDSLVFYPYQGFIHQTNLTNVLTNQSLKTSIQVPPGENIRLELSPSGKYISMICFNSSQYQIYEVGTWKSVEKGQCLDLTWSHLSKQQVEKFGKLEKIFESVDTIKKKKTLGILPSVGKPSKKEEQVFSKILLQTKEMSTNITQELLLNTNQDRLLGGLLLGVYQRNSADHTPGSGSTISSGISSNSSTPTGGSSSSSSLSNSTNSTSSLSSNSGMNTPSSSNLMANVSSKSGSSGVNSGSSSSSSDSNETCINIKGEESEFSGLQLLDWWSLAPIGGQILPPLKIYWNANQTLCAITYSHRFYVYSVREGFQAICMYPLTVTSALWHYNTLFISTPLDIQVLFPHKNESTPLILASQSGIVFPEELYDIQSGSLSSGQKPNQTFSVLPNFKPSGQVSLVEVNNEGLIYLDSNYRFYCLPLSHYLLKFLILAQMESFESAMRCAQMVDHKYHYLMARFLTDRGNARLCLPLQGISNLLKFLVLFNNDCLAESLDCIPPLVHQIKSGQSITNEDTLEEVTLTYLGKMSIEIGKKSQALKDYQLSEKAFRLASTLDPYSAYQQLALQLFTQEKFQELKELQSAIQQNFPIESNLITLFLEQQ